MKCLVILENRKWVAQIKTKHLQNTTIFCFRWKKIAFPDETNGENKFEKSIFCSLTLLETVFFEGLIQYDWDHVYLPNQWNRFSNLVTKRVMSSSSRWLASGSASQSNGAKDRGQWGAVTRRRTRKRNAMFIYEFFWSATMIVGGFSLTF